MGSLKPGQVSGEDLPWHALRSRPSSLQLPWTPLSYRCWLPSSAVLPVSWLVLCWRYCCWPLECWVGFSDTLFSSQSPRLTWRSDLAPEAGPSRVAFLPSPSRCVQHSSSAASPAQPRSSRSCPRRAARGVCVCARANVCVRARSCVYV